MLLILLLRWCRVTKTTAPAAAADRRQEDASECRAEQTVDDEIARRVDDDEQIAQLRVVVMKASTLALGRLEQRPKDLVEERRSLTDDENTDDDNDTQRDVVVFATSTTMTLNVDVGRRLSRCTVPDGVECGNQTNVEESQGAQWNDVHDRVIEHVTVDDLIQLTVAQYHWLIHVLLLRYSRIFDGFGVLTGINLLQQIQSCSVIVALCGFQLA